MSRARVIPGDLKVIGVDFSGIPLDEVSDFRRQQGSAYRAYARDLRTFVLSMSLMSAADQAFEIADRSRDIEARAEDLRRVARRAFRRASIALAFGVACAAWTLRTGDPWDAVFAGGRRLLLRELDVVRPIVPIHIFTKQGIHCGDRLPQRVQGDVETGLSFKLRWRAPGGHGVRARGRSWRV